MLEKNNIFAEYANNFIMKDLNRLKIVLAEQKNW